MASLLDEVRGLISHDATSRLANYRLLVSAVAGETEFSPGVPVTPQFAFDVLSEARKTTEDLAADVEVMGRRKTWAAQVAAGERAKADFDEAYRAYRAAVDAEKEAVERVTREHARRVGEADARVSQIRNDISTADSARMYLISSAPPLASHRLHEIRSKLIPALGGRIVGAEEAVESQRGYLKLYEDALASGRYPAGMSEGGVKQSVGQFREAVREETARLTELEAERDALMVEDATLEGVAMEPWHESYPSLR